MSRLRERDRSMIRGGFEAPTLTGTGIGTYRLPVSVSGLAYLVTVSFGVAEIVNYGVRVIL